MTNKLTDEEIKIFADRLNSENSKDDALFGIYNYGGGQDESFIKANKSGLQLFAAQLLLAATNGDKIIADKEKNIIPLDSDEDWIEGETIIDYVEPTLATRQKPDLPPKENKFKMQLLKWGLILLLFFLVICLIVGFVTIVNDITQ